jgi:tetratricopeptide (TPR) repeat protein
MVRVFVSSTFTDLQEHRKAVDAALRRMKENAVIMEYFGARTEEPTEACFSEIEQCSLFIGLYAHRYGYCPAGGEKSITELEYDYAQERGLKMLCYLVSDDHPWPPKYIEHKAQDKLEAFKNRIQKEHICGTFTTPDNLAQQVATDLARETKGYAGRTPEDRAAAVWQKKFLAEMPPPPPAYMEDSRDDVLREIREKTSKSCKTIVLCGPGGEGKTSILARYAKQYEGEYKRVLWLACGQKIVPEAFANNFQLTEALRPAIPDWKDEWDMQRKFERIVEVLAADERTGLLLLDNADEYSRLAQYRPIFEHTLGRWTCLISTRDVKTDFQQVIRLKPLAADFAFRLFVRLWLGEAGQPTPDDAERLRRLLERIQYHALLTEMLAKHLRVCRDEGLPDTLETLLQNLSDQGLLGLPNTDPVRVEWQGQMGTPQQILARLFDLTGLDENQQTRLLHLALLPETPVTLELLLKTFGIEREADPEEYKIFRAELDALVARGWLDFLHRKGYRVHPLAAETVRQRLLPDFERCRPVVERLRAILDDRKISEARVFLPLAEAVLKNVAAGKNANHGDEENLAVARLARVVGEGYEVSGNLPNAQTYFQQYLTITQTLAHANPHAEQIQRDWAVANSKMGDLALALGQPNEARTFFEKALEISQKLAHANPHAEEIQHDWAVANSKMGDLALALGQPNEARLFFEKTLEIFQTLAHANPHAEQIQRDWAVALMKLGSLEIKTDGDRTRARALLEQAIAVLENRLVLNPHSADLKQRLETAQRWLQKV